jgi:hypothetical protein
MLMSFCEQIKVENALFYQACDQLGIMVIQDMPSLRPIQTYNGPNCEDITYLPNAEQQLEFNRQLEILVNQHKSYTSIVTWVRHISPIQNCFYLIPHFLGHLQRRLGPSN